MTRGDRADRCRLLGVERHEPAVDIPLVNTVDAAGLVVCDLPRVGLRVPLLGSPTPFARPVCWSTKRCAHIETEGRPRI